MDININVNKIRLYLDGETEFDHNKYPLNECISCVVTESTDGVLDLDLEYPIKDEKNLSGLLVRKNIIKCAISTTDKRGEQLFKIRTRTPSTSNKTVKIYAQAIARRDLDNFNMVVDLKTEPGITRKQAMQEILTHCAKPHKFTIGNLDTNTVTNINMGYEDETGNLINYLTINGVSPRSAFLSDSDNSIFKAWGGEIIWNNFEINMVDERGTDNSFEIRSGKNLEELEQTIDDTDLENFVTAIMPVSSDGVYLQNHEIIYSPNHNIIEGGFMKLVCDDVSLVENATDPAAAFDVLYGQLRDRVQKKFDEGIDKLKINNTVKFAQLASTEEYKDFKKLEKCEIGNNVVVKYYEPFDPDKKVYIEATGRVLKIKFNVLTNRIDEVEIGDRKKKNIISTISATINKTTNLDDKTNINKTNIKKKAKEAKDAIEATNKTLADTNTHVVTLEKQTDQVVIDVKDLAKDTEGKFIVQDEKIDAKVSKGSEFSSELALESNRTVITESIAGETDMSVIFDHSGQTVKNGGFRIQNASGTNTMWLTTDGQAIFKDLTIDDPSNCARLKSSFANMKVSFLQVSTSTLVLNHTAFNIDGEYDLYDYVKKVVNEVLTDRGL